MAKKQPAKHSARTKPRKTATASSLAATSAIDDNPVVQQFLEELRSSGITTEFGRTVEREVERRLFAVRDRLPGGAWLVLCSSVQDDEASHAVESFNSDTRRETTWACEFLIEPITAAIDQALKRLDERSRRFLEILRLYPENERLRNIDQFDSATGDRMKAYVAVATRWFRSRFQDPTAQSWFDGLESEQRFFGWLDSQLEAFRKTEETRVDDELGRRHVAFLIERQKLLGGKGLPPNAKPRWDRDAGELWFNGEIVRRVPLTGRAKNVRKILDAFETDGWDRRIDDPLDPDVSARRLPDALKSLKKGLSVINFRGDGSGSGVVWEVVNRQNHPPSTPQ